MTDSRPAGVRILSWLAMMVLLAIGLPLVGAGLVGIGTGRGRAALVVGLALLVCAGGGAALYLPRDPGPTAVSTWTLAGLAAVAALAGIAAAADAAWGWTVVSSSEDAPGAVRRPLGSAVL